MDNDERLARLERKIDFIGEQIILAIAIVVGCVVGYIVEEQIGKGWPVLIGAGLTSGAEVSFIGNTVSNNNAVAGDGSTSAGSW